jgi:predicted HD phosphohydrolase
MRAYLNSLSPSSLRSLALQGGPMSRANMTDFERESYFDEALKLCRIDEASKKPGMAQPGIEQCRGWLESMLPYHARS